MQAGTRARNLAATSDWAAAARATRHPATQRPARAQVETAETCPAATVDRRREHSVQAAADRGEGFPAAAIRWAGHRPAARRCPVESPADPVPATQAAHTTEAGRWAERA